MAKPPNHQHSATRERTRVKREGLGELVSRERLSSKFTTEARPPLCAETNHLLLCKTTEKPWDLCFPSNTHHPLLTPRNNVFAASHNARGCRSVNARQTFTVTVPQKKRLLQYRQTICASKRRGDPTLGLSTTNGDCWMLHTDASALAQPWSAGCGPCTAVHSAACWIQAGTLHGAKGAQRSLAFRW